MVDNLVARCLEEEHLASREDQNPILEEEVVEWTTTYWSMSRCPISCDAIVTCVEIPIS